MGIPKMEDLHLCHVKPCSLGKNSATTCQPQDYPQLGDVATLFSTAVETDIPGLSALDHGASANPPNDNSLMVWKMFYFSMCWECHHLNSLIFSQRGRNKPPTR